VSSTVGDRVALNRSTLDTNNEHVYANEVGIVIGHVRDMAIVSLDHRLKTTTAKHRLVSVPESMIRLVRVSHPGKARRSRPRRKE